MQSKALEALVMLPVLGPGDFHVGPSGLLHQEKMLSCQVLYFHPEFLSIRSRGCWDKGKLFHNTGVLPGDLTAHTGIPRKNCLKALKATSSLNSCGPSPYGAVVLATLDISGPQGMLAHR